jgi:ribosomal protein S12 methylthiotransferase
MKIALITLGCDKNTVDTEYLAGVLAARGHEVAVEGEQRALDVAVLFTCGFIESAREESLDATWQFCEARDRVGNPRRVILAGCLGQRLGDSDQEEYEDFPPVDAIAGVGHPEALADLVEAVAASEEGEVTFPVIPPPRMTLDHPIPRLRLDHSPAAYLKIADGCNHTCSFCAIPSMKGPYVSVPREIVLEEARALLDSGAKELNLVAQDLAPYGRDLYGETYGLPELLEALCQLEGDFRIRLLYLYPAGLTDRFLEVFAREEKICKYLDIPLQHLDLDVLRAMRRPDAGGGIAERIERVRQAAPEVAIRTTMIVGFPGETSQAFKSLLREVEAIRFDWLGAFCFSPEEGTPAAEMEEQVPSRAAERRLDRLMRLQAEITADGLTEWVGRRLRVLVETVSPEEEEARGRSYREAPEVDGEVILKRQEGDPADWLDRLHPGDFVEVEVTDSDTYDLIGRVVWESSAGKD